MPHVHQAPDALRFAWRETDRVTRVVKVTPDTVDPTETERLIQCFGICNALLSRGFLMKSDQQFGRAVVAVFEPLTKLRSRAEKLWFHRVGACPGNHAGRKVELASHSIGFTSELIERVINGKSILLISSLGR